MKQRNPVWFGLESDPPPRESDIQAAESSLGVVLPDSYRYFIREFGGGYFALGNVFSVTPESEWNIVRRIVSLPVSGFVAVSDNGAGDWYGFKVANGVCDDQIYLLDHELPHSPIPTRYSNLFDFLVSTALTRE